MKSKRLWTAAAIIAAAILILFVFSVPRLGEPSRPSTALNSSPESSPIVAYSESYRKGTYTLSGTVTAPDACSSVAAVASLIGDPENPTGILLALTMPPNTGVCLQLPTKVSFSAAVGGPPGLPITATLNGVALPSAPAESGTSASSP